MIIQMEDSKEGETGIKAYLFAIRSLRHNFLRPLGRLFSWATKRLIVYMLPIYYRTAKR